MLLTKCFECSWKEDAYFFQKSKTEAILRTHNLTFLVSDFSSWLKEQAQLQTSVIFVLSGTKPSSYNFDHHLHIQESHSSIVKIIPLRWYTHIVRASVFYMFFSRYCFKLAKRKLFPLIMVPFTPISRFTNLTVVSCFCR